MWEKIKFICGEMGTYLWPFLKKFMIAESKIVINAASLAVRKVADDESLKGKPWQDKLAAAVALVSSEIIVQSVKLSTTEIIPYVQREFELLTEGK